MTNIVRSSVLIFALGSGAGALLTLIVLSRKRKQRDTDDRSRAAIAEAEARRHLLPSTIILVRHGQSVANAVDVDPNLNADVRMPDNIVPLTPKGVQQSIDAGRRVERIMGQSFKGNKHLRVHMVVSPFERSLQTARNMRAAFEHRIVRTDIEPRIREQEYGNIQHSLDFQMYREEQKKVGRFWYRFPTGESGADVYTRIKSWWNESVLNVNTRVGYERVDALVVVCHGLAIRFILMQLFNWSPTTFHTVWNLGNAEMYVLRKDLNKPGPSPYVLDTEVGDAPRSSIELMVGMKDGTKDVYTLHNYLSIPPPRTSRLELVKKKLAEEYSNIDPSKIESIEFMPFIDGDVVHGRTSSDCCTDTGDVGLHLSEHNRNASESNHFFESAQESGLRRCDSCTVPLPTIKWKESF